MIGTDISKSTIEDSFWRILLYGPAGAGKTELYGSFPKPIWVADFDQKMKPLYGVDGVHVSSYTVKSPEDAKTVFLQFKRDWKAVSQDPEVKTMVLDSLTSFDTINLKYFTTISKGGIESTPSLPVYGDQGSYYAYFFTEIKSIQKNVIVTAHEYYNVDGESGIHSIQPLITGRTILHKLPSVFEEVWYLERGGGDKRILHYRPYKKAIATSTALKGSGEIELPSLKDGGAYPVIIKETK